MKKDALYAKTADHPNADETNQDGVLETGILYKSAGALRSTLFILWP